MLRSNARIVAAAGLCLFAFVPGCRVAQHGRTTPSPSPVNPDDAQPKVTILYPPSMAKGQYPIPHNDSFSIDSPDGGPVYFSIEAPILADDAGGPNPIHDKLHFVLGGSSTDNTSGSAVIQGVKTDENGSVTFSAHDGVFLVDVESGWVWVSDCPPPNWPQNGCVPNDCSQTASSFTASTGAAPNTVPAWAGWSDLTLLKALWTWAGAIGTRFVCRVAPADTSGGYEFVKVYSLDGCPANISKRATAGDGQIKDYSIENDLVRRAPNQLFPENPVQFNNPNMPGYQDNKAFLDEVDDALQSISP